MTVIELYDLMLEGPDKYYLSPDTRQFFGSAKQKVETTKDYVLYSEDRTNAPDGLPSWLGAVISRETGAVLARGEGFSRKEAMADAIRTFGRPV